jgi:ABC-type glycerol-3-phosphate transport system substrate-binding protein
MYGSAGWLEDLGPVVQEADIDLNDWPQELIEVSSWDGTLYRIPWGAEVELFFYRTDLFKKAGITPPEEWDWDEFLEVAKALTKGEDQLGIALNGQKNGVLGNDIQKWTNQAGGAVNDLDNPGSKQALTFYKDLYAKHKVAPASTPEEDYDTNLQGFLSGKYATWWVWDGLYSGIIGEEDVKEQVSTLAPPKGPENAQSTTACWGWAISEYSQKKDLASQWVQYCNRPDTMKMLGNAGRVPGRISLMDDPKIREMAPQSAFMEPLFKSGDLVKARPVTPKIQEVYDAAETNIHAYLTDQVDLDTAVERAMAEMRR